MLRYLILLLALTLLPLGGMAEEPSLTFSEDLTGVYTWPEGSQEDAASYVYRYAYPQIDGDSMLAITLNNVFEYEATDALGFECPMIGSSHDPAQGQMLVNVSYTITHLSVEYLSVRIDKTVRVGDTVSNIVKAYTFTLTGADAGTVTSLPYLLGLVKQGENDEWLIDRQTAKADACARDMVWALIEKDAAKADSPIWPEFTFEKLEWSFYPEEDFYLNEAGDLVFFLQENIIAPQTAGQFFYTIPVEDLLDEI